MQWTEFGRNFGVLETWALQVAEKISPKFLMLVSL